MLSTGAQKVRLSGKIKDREPARGRARAWRPYHPGLCLLVTALLSETLAETGVLTAFIVTIKNINGPRIQSANESFLEMLFPDLRHNSV